MMACPELGDELPTLIRIEADGAVAYFWEFDGLHP
jgi:hypothetical protein